MHPQASPSPLRSAEAVDPILYFSIPGALLTPRGILHLQVAYHSRDIEGMECRYANPPVSVKEDLGAVMDAISSRFNMKHR